MVIQKTSVVNIRSFPLHSNVNSLDGQSVLFEYNKLI